MNRGEWMMKHIFLDRSPRRMIADLRTIVPQWQPDMIVSGSFEYGGPLAAERAGLPYATANYTVRWNRWVRKHALGRPIARLRAETGLPADPDMNAFERYLDLCFAPPSWTFERPPSPKVEAPGPGEGAERGPTAPTVVGCVRALLLQTDIPAPYGDAPWAEA